MATTKKAQTTEKKPAKKAATKKEDRYFYAVGRRKTAIAQARIWEDDKATESEFIVNDKKLKDYFPTAYLQGTCTAPMKVLGLTGKFRVSVLVRGGGSKGQAEACRLAISRAIVKFDETHKKLLKDNGFLTRDARKVERKKPGLKKARRAPQWAKR